MPPAAVKNPVLLVCGEDEFGVKLRGREVFQQWSGEIGGSDHEVIDAYVNNSGEALAALAKLREALQTLPFFGSGKVVWLQSCNFFGEERAASAQAVTESLASLAQELKGFVWRECPAAGDRWKSGQAQSHLQDAGEDWFRRGFGRLVHRRPGLGGPGRKLCQQDVP